MKKMFVASLGILMVLSSCSLDMKPPVATQADLDAAKTKAETFINDNLMGDGRKATIKDVTDDTDAYKLKVDIGSGQEVVSYLSKDLKKFYPEAMVIAEVEAMKNNKNVNAEPQKTTEVPKTEKPVVEVFVMSYCPFGTQIEKGLLPVVDLLGDKIDYTLKFCDYIMHGDIETQENLLQYCIQKEEPAKLSPYLTCFLKKGEGTSDACMKEAKVNVTKIKACTKAADKEFGITAGNADKSKWKGNFPPFDVYKEDNAKYGVQGSPTLVINGVQVQTARDSANLLKVICNAFTTQPAECSETLSSASPTPGFGEGTQSGSSSSGSCN